MEHLLKQHGLRVTEARLIVLEVFLRTGQVFDHHALLAACGGRVDRVTLYRTLHVFHLHDLLYKVPSASGVMQYGLRGFEARRRRSHLHLVCQVCGRITSVDPFEAPDIALPAGFKSETMEMIVNGTCIDCRKAKTVSAPRQGAQPRPGQTRPRP